MLQFKAKEIKLLKFVLDVNFVDILKNTDIKIISTINFKILRARHICYFFNLTSSSYKYTNKKVINKFRPSFVNSKNTI